MPITRIRDIRRKELLKAALEVMTRDGLQATTIDKIAKEAGASKGLVHHYFRDKDELTEMTIRFLYSLRHNEIVKRLRASNSPSDRLWAIISVSLQKNFFYHDLCSVLISVNAAAYENERLARLQRIVRRRERANLLHALRQLSSTERALELVIGIMAVVEGCRLWAGYIPTFDSGQATALVLKFLKQEIPHFNPRVAWK
jgi:TetR/AcrR family transcriptional repressor of bet genes